MSALFKRRDYPRLCDVCGHRWMFSQLRYIGLGRYACPDDKGMLTREQIARHMARPIPQLFRPRKHPRPMVDTAATYQATEAEFLRLAATYALTSFSVSQQGTTVSGINYTAAAICGVYFGDMVVEAKRPRTWLDLATAKLIAIADTLISRQYGAPGGLAPGESTTSVRYGGVLEAENNIHLNLVTYAGVAFLRAFAITGIQKYLDAADRAGHFMRNLQRCDQWTASFTVSSLGGSGRLYLGGWPVYVSSTTKAPLQRFELARAIGLWFLAELRAVRGGSAVYGSAVAGGDFASPTAATIDQAVADAIAFYVVGKIADLGSSTPTAPLSSTTPRRHYNAFLSSGGGDGLWHLDGSPETTIPGWDIAKGIRGVFEAVGYTPGLAVVYEWLMSFTSNPAFETTATFIASKVSGLTTGTYDPTFCLAATLQVRDQSLAPVKTNGSSTYMLAAMGALAPVHIASGRSLTAIKDEIEKKKPTPGATGPAGRYASIYLGPNGQPETGTAPMGLGFQAANQNISPEALGWVGQLFRHQPQSWNGVSVF